MTGIWVQKTYIEEVYNFTNDELLSLEVMITPPWFNDNQEIIWYSEKSIIELLKKKWYAWFEEALMNIHILTNFVT
jgi:hypothetical protein